MENFREELKAMLYLSGRMNRRSYVMNLLMIFGIGYLGGDINFFGTRIRIFLGAWMAHHRIFCGSRAGNRITAYP